MIQVIALTQFAFVALGSISILVLSRAQTVANVGEDHLRHFLAAHTLWRLVVPIAWSIFARVVLKQSSKPAVSNVVQGSGIALSVLIVAVYGWLILSF